MLFTENSSKLLYSQACSTQTLVFIANTNKLGGKGRVREGGLGLLLFQERIPVLTLRLS